jgi:hypothetical protein
MEQSRLTELDTLIDDQLREFGKSSQLRESAGKYADPLTAYRNGPPKAKSRKPIDKFASPLEAYRKSPKAKIAAKFRGVVRRAKKLV